VARVLPHRKVEGLTRPQQGVSLLRVEKVLNVIKRRRGWLVIILAGRVRKWRRPRPEQLVGGVSNLADRGPFRGDAEIGGRPGPKLPGHLWKLVITIQNHRGGRPSATSAFVARRNRLR